MIVKSITIQNYLSTFFCEDVIKIGDFVFGNYGDHAHNSGCLICRNFETRRTSDVLLGVSLHQVVDIDITKEFPDGNKHQVTKNSKIHIMTRGELTFNLADDKIPYGQKMYLSDFGTPTWRRSKYPIGRTSSVQNEHGYVNIEIKI